MFRRTRASAATNRGSCTPRVSTSSSTTPSRTWQAHLGLAAWFFGNLYEGVVGMPQLLADARAGRPPRVLGPGSPLRYYAPLAPLVLSAVTTTSAKSWRAGGDRRSIAVCAVSTVSAVAMSAHLVRTVNLKLLTTIEPLGLAEQQRMIRTWHAINAIRLAAIAIAAASAHHASTNNSTANAYSNAEGIEARQ